MDAYGSKNFKDLIISPVLISPCIDSCECNSGSNQDLTGKYGFSRRTRT